MSADAPSAVNRSPAQFVVHAATWIVFLTSLLLLRQVMFEVMSVGGFCARGGPYEITVECSDRVMLFGTLSIPLMVAAMLANGILVRQWGPSLLVWFWPILFTTLGVTFLQGAQFDGYSTGVGWFLGIMFIVMSGSPLLLVSLLLGKLAPEFFALRTGSAPRLESTFGTKLKNLGSSGTFTNQSAVHKTPELVDAFAGVGFVVVCALVSWRLVSIILS